MKLHFTPEWLRRRIQQDGDHECEAGPDLVETLDLLVRVMDTSHPDAAAAVASASALRRLLREDNPLSEICRGQVIQQDKPKPGTLEYAQKYHEEMTRRMPGETEIERGRRHYYQGFDDDGLPCD